MYVYIYMYTKQILHVNIYIYTYYIYTYYIYIYILHFLLAQIKYMVPPEVIIKSQNEFIT